MDSINERNLEYQQINWGWLNDYSGYKFAPITFFDKIYTETGAVFSVEYRDFLNKLRNGGFLVKDAQRLSYMDEGVIKPYGQDDPHPEKPVYFSNGIPVQCPGPIEIDLVGNVNNIDNYSGYTIKAGTIYGDTINSNIINSNNIQNAETITSQLFHGDIQFRTPLTFSWSGDATGSTTYVGNQGFNVALTLKSSGVAASTYGPSANATLNHEDTFTVPKFTVDAKGLITSAGTVTYTLPEGSKVSISQVTDDEINAKTKRYILTNSASGSEATDNVLKYYTGIYVDYDPDASSVSEQPVLMGAAWNDYAEYRNQIDLIEAGYCVCSNDDGLVSKTTEKLQSCDGIVSDTFGFAIGKTDTYKTPLAVAGRVLAYCTGNREDYHSGDTVCAGPEGKVCKMTREEIKEYPDRIVGTVSEIPQYEEWSGKKVNNRIWIKIK